MAVRMSGPKQAKKSIESIPKVSGYDSLEKIPIRTLSFWLDHITSVAKLQSQHTFPLGLIRDTPADLFRTDASLLTRPFWTALLNKLSSIQDLACSPQAQGQLIKDYIMAAQTTLRKLANQFVGVNDATYFWNFQTHGFYFDGSRSKQAYLEQVVQDAQGAQECYSPQLHAKVNIIGKHQPLIPVKNCKTLKKKYFKNGVPPLPRISSE